MKNNHESTIQAVDIHTLLDELVEEVKMAVRQEMRKLNTPAKKELLTQSEAAKEYGMTESYWRKQIFHRFIPYVKMGKSVRLRRKDIEAFIEENKIEA